MRDYGYSYEIYEPESPDGESRKGAIARAATQGKPDAPGGGTPVPSYSGFTQKSERRRGDSSPWGSGHVDRDAEPGHHERMHVRVGRDRGALGLRRLRLSVVARRERAPVHLDAEAPAHVGMGVEHLPGKRIGSGIAKQGVIHPAFP